jgi:hypothetical protein
MANKLHANVGADEVVIKNGAHGHDDYDSDQPGYDSDNPGYDSDNSGYDDGDYSKPYTKPKPKPPYQKQPPEGPVYPPVRPNRPLKSMGYFETPIPVAGLFDGEIFASVHEDGGIAPTNIIRIDQDWGVLVKWRTSGVLTRMICGTWCLNVCLESIGPGEELRLPLKTYKVELDPCSAKGNPLTCNYKCYIEIPRGTVKPKHCTTPYKIVTTLTYLEPCGTPGPIAGFVEGQILQFYEP